MVAKMFFPTTLVFHNIIKYLLFVDPLPTSILNIFLFFLCLRISTDRDLSIRAIKSYIMRCSTPRRAYFNFIQSIYCMNQNVFIRITKKSSKYQQKISKNIWLKASQRGRSFKPLKSHFGKNKFNSIQCTGATVYNIMKYK